VLVRLAGLTAVAKAQIVSQVIALHGTEMPGSFSVISPGTVRIRDAQP
jgi:hypothetical protein